MWCRTVKVVFLAIASFVCPLLSGSAPAESVPVVRCQTEFGISGPAPHTPSVLTVGSSASHLVAYTNTQVYLLAPTGMRCLGIAATDGGSQVIVWPRGSGRPGFHSHTDGLTLTLDPACAGCKAGDACPFFTDLALKLRFPCTSGIPAGERVSRLRSNLALFEDPPGVAGSGWPSGGSDPANGLVGYAGSAYNGAVYRSTCTLPVSDHSVCTASLNDVISRYG